MSWGDIGHIVMVLYLVVLFIWVQHLMIKMTRMQRELDQLKWSLEQESNHPKITMYHTEWDYNAPTVADVAPKRCMHQWMSTANGWRKCQLCGEIDDTWSYMQ